MKRTLSSEEIKRNRIAVTATKVAMLADEANDKQKSKYDEVENLIKKQYLGDINLQLEDEVKLLRSVLIGCLHAQGNAPDGFEGTFSIGNAIRHMGSSYRPTEHRDFDYMFEAVTDAVGVMNGSELLLMHELKTDFTNVFDEFHAIRKAAIDVEAAYSLFSHDTPVIETGRPTTV